MKLCSEAKDEMKRFEMLFLNDSRECIFQKPMSEITVGGRELGPFKKGDQVNLPNWMIEQLLKHDIVDIVPEDAYDSLRRLQNLYREEEKQPHKLQTFQPYLYTALSRKVLRLQSDRTSIDPRKYDEIEKLQRMLPFLVETRLSKILRVAKSGAYQDKRKQMAYEERWLCEELIDLLSGWRQNIME
jgi:DNA replication initiation complex subunit (GINS family)